ncbi:MAG: hypothetical protein NTY22_05320 [Proteobacteria bacterium]|nr:hypothetical protein [Pseudomonadota bacterium]
MKYVCSFLVILITVILNSAYADENLINKQKEQIIFNTLKKEAAFLKLVVTDLKKDATLKEESIKDPSNPINSILVELDSAANVLPKETNVYFAQNYMNDSMLRAEKAFFGESWERTYGYEKFRKALQKVLLQDKFKYKEFDDEYAYKEFLWMTFQTSYMEATVRNGKIIAYYAYVPSLSTYDKFNVVNPLISVNVLRMMSVHPDMFLFNRIFLFGYNEEAKQTLNELLSVTNTVSNSAYDMGKGLFGLADRIRGKNPLSFGIGSTIYTLCDRITNIQIPAEFSDKEKTTFSEFQIKARQIQNTWTSIIGSNIVEDLKYNAINRPFLEAAVQVLLFSVLDGVYNRPLPTARLGMDKVSLFERSIVNKAVNTRANLTPSPVRLGVDKVSLLERSMVNETVGTTRANLPAELKMPQVEYKTVPGKDPAVNYKDVTTEVSNRAKVNTEFPKTYDDVMKSMQINDRSPLYDYYYDNKFNTGSDYPTNTTRPSGSSPYNTKETVVIEKATKKTNITAKDLSQYRVPVKMQPSPIVRNLTTKIPTNTPKAVTSPINTATQTTTASLYPVTQEWTHPDKLQQKESTSIRPNIPSLEENTGKVETSGSNNKVPNIQNNGTEIMIDGEIYIPTSNPFIYIKKSDYENRILDPTKYIYLAGRMIPDIKFLGPYITPLDWEHYDFLNGVLVKVSDKEYLFTGNCLFSHEAMLKQLSEKFKKQGTITDSPITGSHEITIEWLGEIGRDKKTRQMVQVNETSGFTSQYLVYGITKQDYSFAANFGVPGVGIWYFQEFLETNQELKNQYFPNTTYISYNEQNKHLHPILETVSALRHDLNTPFNGLQGFTKLLIDGIGVEDEKDIIMSLDQLKKSASTILIDYPEAIIKFPELNTLAWRSLKTYLEMISTAKSNMWGAQFVVGLINRSQGDFQNYSNQVISSTEGDLIILQ